MDLDTIRALITAASFATFLGVVGWAYSVRRKSGFDRAAQSILDEGDDPQGKVRGDGQ
jgi:cbb3-type cytochrome oxidase subunit 3